MSIENTLKNRRSIRLPDYDYRQAGAYFVTICSYNKNCLLGTIRGDDMILNELGTVVENAWLQIPKSRTNVILDAFVVMPNHLHGILILIEDPDIIPSGFTVPSLARNSTLQSGSLGATIGQFKSAVTKR